MAHLHLAVIGSTSDIGMDQPVDLRGRFRIDGLPVHARFQNRLDALVRNRLKPNGASAGRFEPLLRVTVSQTKDSQAGPVALFRVGSRLEDSANRFDSPGPDSFSQATESLWSP